MTIQETYKGWKNRETWNVALWIGNDEGLYKVALNTKDYEEFKSEVKEIGNGNPISYETPDQVAWNDSGIDVEAIDNMIKELKG